MAILLDFPAFEQEATPGVPMSHLAPTLSAKVAIGIHNATKVAVQYQHLLRQHDQDATRVVLLMMTEVIGRSASQPDATVNELFRALWEQIPEDTRTSAEGKQ